MFKHLRRKVQSARSQPARTPKVTLKINDIKNRLLPLSPAVQGGKQEHKTTDFESTSRKLLGKGAFADVWPVRNKITQERFAVKLIKKATISRHGLLESIRREITLMYQLNHENVIRLVDHFEDEYKVYLLLEYASNGTLFDVLTKKKSLEPQEAANYLRQMVHALECLGKKNIIHRDIKPENILLNEEGKLKLADFGFACLDDEGVETQKFCGTAEYLSPEVIKAGVQHRSLDVWSLGILLFEMLTGRPPFEGKGLEQLQYRILNVKINYPADMQAEAKDLITKLLNPVAEQRIQLGEIENHPFFQKSAEQEQTRSQDDLQSQSVVSCSTDISFSDTRDNIISPIIKSSEPILMTRWREPKGKIQLSLITDIQLVQQPEIEIFNEENKIADELAPADPTKKVVNTPKKLVQLTGETNDLDLWLESIESPEKHDLDEQTTVNETTSQIMTYFTTVRNGIELVNLGWVDI